MMCSAASAAGLVLQTDDQLRLETPRLLSMMYSAASAASLLPQTDDILSRVCCVLQIRRWRKELGKSARARGFALCAQYTLDASALSLAQVLETPPSLSTHSRGRAWANGRS